MADGATPPLTHSHLQPISEPIYSSDFSAFTKRSYCPSLLRFFCPKYHIRTRFIHLHFGDCLQWNFVLLAVKCHGVSPLSTAVPTCPASGQDLASSTRALEVVGMAHTGPRAVMDILPVEVQETIASARTPATRKLYSSKWGVFESWCLARAIDPVNCPVGPVLEFLQERLTARAAATTLRVYVAAIAAWRELDEIPLGRHRMVSAFMRGVRRLRPVRPTAVPSWDLSVFLEGLVMAPFEPLESASERILTLKVTLLLALTSLKRVGDWKPSLLVRCVWTLPRV